METSDPTVIRHVGCGCTFKGDRLHSICTDHAQYANRIKNMATQIEREACARIAMQPWNWWKIAKKIRERGDGSPVY